MSRVHIAPKCNAALPWVRSNTPATREVIGWTVLDIIKMQTDAPRFLPLLERRICSAPELPPKLRIFGVDYYRTNTLVISNSELIHPTAHSHFTICHTLHFNSNTIQTGLHVHTAQIQQSICYHWIPSNAHPWHLRIQLMYNLLPLCILLCVYICVHNVECVHTVYNVYW